MKRRLRPHQKQAYSYTYRATHPALFMEMRLGKTLVAIRRIQAYPQRGDRARILVVAPSSALGGWSRELAAEGETFAFLQGTRKQRLGVLHKRCKGSRQWYLINKEGHLSLPEIANVPWTAVVLDESVFIKNPRTRVTKFFLKHFRDVPHRWVLTGTPNPESDLEFWAQMAFLDDNGNAFGCRSFWDFRAQKFRPKFWQHQYYPKPGTASAIKRELSKRAFIMSRRDAGMDVRKVYERRTFNLPRKIRSAYQTLEREFLLEIDNKELKRTAYAPVKMCWLRQLCGGYAQKNLVWSGKFEELLTLARGELRNEQFVVWFNFNIELDTAYYVLRRKQVMANRIRGKEKVKDRRRIIEDFRSGRTRVLLLQQAVAQTGLDLSAADTAIYFSPPLGAMARQQTEDRIVDVTKSGPLLILDFLVEDSVDEAILEALEGKEARSESILRRVYQIMQKNREGSHG